jgi:hypothetical protein
MPKLSVDIENHRQMKRIAIAKGIRSAPRQVNFCHP